jgi:hypothetical protein
MSLSALTPLTEAQYRALTITPFVRPPQVSRIGNPDSRVGIQLGGWVGTDVLAFTITDQAGASSDLCIDGRNSDTLDVGVIGGINPTLTQYWTVNMGEGASGTDWEISYGVSNGGVSTGTWVFVKGKSVND